MTLTPVDRSELSEHAVGCFIWSFWYNNLLLFGDIFCLVLLLVWSCGIYRSDTQAFGWLAKAGGKTTLLRFNVKHFAIVWQIE